MIPTAFQLTTFLLTGVTLLTFLGFGPARLLLPPRHERLTLVASPLLGFCVAAIGASWLTSTVLPMTAATPVILLAGLLLNAAAVWRRGWPGLRAQEGRGVALVTIAAYSAAGIPLVVAGTQAFLGNQWDLELYLPIAEYLKRTAIGAALSGPDNPLLAGMNNPAFRGGSGWGFSYVEAMFGVVLDRMSYATFRPMLHFCYALGAPAVYLTARMVFAAGPRTATLAAALWALNGFNLWLAASGLAGHAAAFFLIPLAATFALLAVETTSYRSAALAAIAISGMLLTYYTGALLVWGALTLAVGVPLMLRTRHWAALLRTGLATGGLVLALAFVGHLRFLEVLPVYQDAGFTKGWNVVRFIPLAQIFGLAPDAVVANQGGPRAALGATLPVVLDVAAGVGALLCLGALLVAAVTGGWRRSRFIQTGVAFALLLVAMRFVLQYPYGYFKVVSLGSFVGSVAFAHVAVTLWQRPQRVARALRLVRRVWRGGPAGRRSGAPPQLPAPLRWGAAAGFALLVALMALNTVFSVQFFWPDRDVRPRAVWELAGMKAALPAGATVNVPPMQGVNRQDAALVAYFLLDNPITGQVQTAYGLLAHPAAPETADYVLLNQNRLWEFDTGAWSRVWGNEFVTLFRTGTGEARSEVRKPN